jgi:transposase
VRLIKQTSIDVHTPRVVGIDDVALRRGQRYGTVLVDREQRRPIDVLPDRDAQTLEPWLQAHRGVEMVTRDRSPAYARGATAGAPRATHVADRWHLLLNLREMLERLLERLHGRLQALPSRYVPATVVRHRRHLRGPSEDHARTARRARRRQRYGDVLVLYQQGKRMRQLAPALHLSRWTVQHFLHSEGYPERLPHRGRPTILTPFEA